MTLYNCRLDFSILLIPHHELLLFFIFVKPYFSEAAALTDAVNFFIQSGFNGFEALLVRKTARCHDVHGDGFFAARHRRLFVRIRVQEKSVSFVKSDASARNVGHGRIDFQANGFFQFCNQFAQHFTTDSVVAVRRIDRKVLNEHKVVEMPR